MAPHISTLRKKEQGVKTSITPNDLAHIIFAPSNVKQKKKLAISGRRYEKERKPTYEDLAALSYKDGGLFYPTAKNKTTGTGAGSDHTDSIDASGGGSVGSGSLKDRNLNVQLLERFNKMIERHLFSSGLAKGGQYQFQKGQQEATKNPTPSSKQASKTESESQPKEANFLKTLMRSIGQCLCDLKDVIASLVSFVYSETKEATERVLFFILEKLIALLELFCDIRGRSNSYFGRQPHGVEETGPGSAYFDKNSSPLAQNVFVYFVSFIMGTLYFAFWVFIDIAQKYPDTFLPENLQILTIVFHVLLGMCGVAYYKGVTTSPGYVRDDPAEFERWRSEEHAMRYTHERKKAAYTQEELEELGLGDKIKHPELALRYCQKEEIFKPDRAHFCKVSGKNILRMDHHCPWLLNTIGLKNQKFFFLFLLYATSCTNLLTINFVHLFSLYMKSEIVLPTSTAFFLFQTEMLSGLLSMALNPFLIIHSYFIAKNLTTLEFFEKYWAKPGGQLEDADADSDSSNEARSPLVSARRESPKRVNDFFGGSSKEELQTLEEEGDDLGSGVYGFLGKASDVFESAKEFYEFAGTAGIIAAQQAKEILEKAYDDPATARERTKKLLQETAERTSGILQQLYAKGYAKAEETYAEYRERMMQKILKSPEKTAGTLKASSLGNLMDGDLSFVMNQKKEKENLNPYDIGLYGNIAQVMGSGNPLSWFLPFIDSYPQSAIGFDIKSYQESYRAAAESARGKANETARSEKLAAEELARVLSVLKKQKEATGRVDLAMILDQYNAQNTRMAFVGTVDMDTVRFYKQMAVSSMQDRTKVGYRFPRTDVTLDEESGGQNSSIVSKILSLPLAILGFGDEEQGGKKKKLNASGFLRSRDLDTSALNASLLWDSENDEVSSDDDHEDRLNTSEEIVRRYRKNESYNDMSLLSSAHKGSRFQTERSQLESEKKRRKNRRQGDNSRNDSGVLDTSVNVFSELNEDEDGEEDRSPKSPFHFYSDADEVKADRSRRGGLNLNSSDSSRCSDDDRAHKDSNLSFIFGGDTSFVAVKPGLGSSKKKRKKCKSTELQESPLKRMGNKYVTWRKQQTASMLQRYLGSYSAPIEDAVDDVQVGVQYLWESVVTL